MPNGRRTSDFPENYHIEESIELGEISLDFTNIKPNEDENKKIFLENEAKKIIENIDNDPCYIKIKVEKLSNEELENGDVFVINFIKNHKNDELNITLKFGIKKIYLSKVEGYILVSDDETKLKSKAKEEVLSLPILLGYKRKIQLKNSLLEGALFVSLDQYLLESKIKEIILYKRSGNKKGIKSLTELIKFRMSKLIGK